MIISNEHPHPRPVRMRRNGYYNSSSWFVPFGPPELWGDALEAWFDQEINPHRSADAHPALAWFYDMRYWPETVEEAAGAHPIVVVIWSPDASVRDRADRWRTITMKMREFREMAGDHTPGGSKIVVDRPPTGPGTGTAMIEALGADADADDDADHDEPLLP